MARLSYAGKLFREFIDFARENKVYWIVPLVLVLLLAALVVIGAQSSAPFVYTLF